MSRPLDELLALAGSPSSPAPDRPSEHSFAVVVRTQGRRPRALAEALDSIASQTDAAAEVVVVVHDDRPAIVAEVEAIASDAGCPCRVVSTTGGGRARPLNVGLRACTADYVCFLDDDDLARPRWIEAFRRGAGDAPGQILRAVTVCQDWTTDGGEQPVRAVGDLERPFASRFDLLAHMSHNETPICSVAWPRDELARLGLSFDEDLPVFEDWDLLMRAGMLLGVHSLPDETTLYRRLDHGNADTVHDPAEWTRAHATVIEKLSAAPVLLPPGAAARLASAHFTPGGPSRHEQTIAGFERSGWWRMTAVPRRLVGRLQTALAARRSRPSRR